MALKAAFQMDPIDRIDIRGDSTFALLLEAQRRGHELFYYEPAGLSMMDGRLHASGHEIEVQDDPDSHYRLGEPRRADLSEFDVVHLRQDPPFDMSYITTTHLLEKIHPETLVVNDPAHVRNAPEKLFVTEYLDLMPPTLITRSVEDVKAFRVEHQDIIVKPLYGNGGAGVFHIAPGDENLNVLLELFTEHGAGTLIGWPSGAPQPGDSRRVTKKSGDSRRATNKPGDSRRATNKPGDSL